MGRMTCTRYATEYDEAVSLMQWTEFNKSKGESIRKLTHIPNEVKLPGRDLKQDFQVWDKLCKFMWAVIAKHKAQGVRPGTPDYFSPVARGKYHGIWIELKTKKGTLSKPQKRWERWITEENHLHVTAYGWEEAAKALLQYEALGPYLQPEEERQQAIKNQGKKVVRRTDGKQSEGTASPA